MIMLPLLLLCSLINPKELSLSDGFTFKPIKNLQPLKPPILIRTAVTSFELRQYLLPSQFQKTKIPEPGHGQVYIAIGKVQAIGGHLPMG